MEMQTIGVNQYENANASDMKEVMLAKKAIYHEDYLVPVPNFDDKQSKQMHVSNQQKTVYKIIHAAVQTHSYDNWLGCMSKS